MTTDVATLGTILGVWAHPDDENFLCGGIMAAAVRNGQRVVNATATKGEKGSADESQWPSLGALREKELAACLARLGVKEHHWLDAIDGECPLADAEEMTAKIAALIEEVQPDTVLTFGPDAMTGHSDHLCVSQWTTAAFARTAPPGAQLYYATKTPAWNEAYLQVLKDLGAFYEGFVPPETNVAELGIHFVCDDDLLQLKFEAAMCHESQITGLLEAVGRDFMYEGIREEPFAKA